MSYRIYHNPRCSKSRQTLSVLQEKGIDPEVIEYLKTPLSIQELKEVVKLLGISAYELLRTKEAEYVEAGLNKNSSDEAIYEAMVKYPKLIERPIIIKDDKSAVIGRPPENVLKLVD